MIQKNGILSSRLLDKFFDRLLISFDFDFEIFYSGKLSKKHKKEIKKQTSNTDYKNIITQNTNEKYLKYHRKNIFQKNKLRNDYF